jgi:hypothetical protein
MLRFGDVLLASVLLIPSAAAQVNLPQPLLSGQGADGQLLGNAVATDGTTIAIGSPGLPGWALGRVLVYERLHGTWTLVKTWTPNVWTGGEFGSDVAVEGDVIAAAAPGVAAAPGQEPGGRAFVLERLNGVWTQTAVLTSPEQDLAHRFGAAVAISGGRLLITHEGAGHAHVFQKLAGTWTAVAQITPSVTDASFGDGAALDGNQAAISASQEDAPAIDSGAVYTFVFDGSTWNQTARLVSPTPVAHGLFGLSFDLEGDRLAIGEPRGGLNFGRVLPFREVAGAWQPLPALKEPPPLTMDSFGYGVTLDGPRLLAGSIGWDGFKSPGRVHLFEEAGTGYAHVVEFHGPGGGVGDGAGGATALAGDLGVIGSAGQAGSFHIMNLAASTWQDLGGAYVPQPWDVPHLYGFGSLKTGAPGSIELEMALAQQPSLLLIAVGAPTPVLFHGGTLQASPFVLAIPFVAASPQGQIKIPFTMLPGLEGLSFVAQYAIKNNNSPAGGVELSNAIQGNVP